ncbi:hypothetical protein GCM10029976_053360 [Kribbella albertanoniae]
MGVSVRRVTVVATAVALLMSGAVGVQAASTAEAVTCVRSSSDSFYVRGGTSWGFGVDWPGGNAKVKVTYRTPNSTTNIRVRLAVGGSSSSTILKGNAGRQVTKTVSVGYKSRGDGTLWFEASGGNPDSRRSVTSWCLYKS